MPSPRASLQVSLAVTLLASLAAGCATRAGYDARLNAWVGRPVDGLIVRMGPPQGRSPLSSGGEVLEWVDQNGALGTLICRTRVVVSSGGIITGASTDGNNCVG